MRTTRTTRSAAAAALLATAIACGGGDNIPEPVTEIDVVDARREMSEERSRDPFVVDQLVSPAVPGRVIYDPPPSLANVPAADTLVRRENTGLTSPQGTARAAAPGGAPAAGARDTGRAAGATRDTSARP
ncbi:MAG TPA: hypothetical protein VFZ11_00685 [Gemmatimonadaceae bacterium]